jgi:hypothetical protein
MATEDDKRRAGDTITAESLIQEISVAFASVSRGDGISLHEADEIDNHSSEADQAEARKIDVDEHWTNVPDEWIEQYPSAYFFLDAAGFRYYLPAVMVWDLKHGPASTSSSADNIESLLLGHDWRGSPPALKFTEAQCRATARWLNWQALLLYNPEQAARELEDTAWGRYLAKKT